MPDLDVKLLQEQLTAAAERIVALPRYQRGYKGHITVEDVVVVVAVRCEDGALRYIDPAEVSDAEPDCFVRDFVRVPNGRPNTSVLDLLQRFLPLIAPKLGGWLSGLSKWVKW